MVKFDQKTRKSFKKASEMYQDNSEKEKNKKWQYGRKWYKNLSEDKKQRLVEHTKNITKFKKKCSGGQLVDWLFEMSEPNFLSGKNKKFLDIFE